MWEWKLATNANSGVKYFVNEQRKDKHGKLYGSAIAHEYQLLDDNGPTSGKVSPKEKTAAFYQVLPPANNKPLKPVGEWNQSQIIVSGKHVEHWLNGEKVLEYETDSPEVSKAIAASKFKDVPDLPTTV